MSRRADGLPDEGGSMGAEIVTIVPLPPTYRGGTEEYAYRVARRLAERHPVRLLTTTMRWQPGAPAVDTGGVPLEMLPARERFQRPVLDRAGRRRLLEAVDTAAAVHLHMPFPFVEAAVAARARRRGIPMVLTYHMDADLADAEPGPLSGAVTWLYRQLSAHRAIRDSAVVVANSRGYAESSPVLSRHLGKVRVIHKGVDSERLLAGKASTEAPGATPRLLYVGRLVPYKGVGQLLEAAARLKSRGEGFELLIGGSGPLEAALKARAADLGLARQCRFLGFVPDAELGRLYRSASVVVCPSIGRLESSVTVLEEAATLGTPVVGADLPGASETIPNDGRRGLLVPPGDVEALTEALARLLHAPRPEPPTTLRRWEEVASDYWELLGSLGLGR